MKKHVKISENLDKMQNFVKKKK